MDPQKLLGDVKVHLARYERELQLDQYPLLNQLHSLTGGTPRIYLLLGTGAAALFLTTIIFGLSFISNVVGFYPLYWSFKALRSPGTNDDEYWLTYWVVYATFGLFESLIDGIFFWLPLYFLVKTAFLVYCFLPQTRGAEVVYKNALAPLFARLEGDVDNAINSATSTTTTTSTTKTTAATATTGGTSKNRSRREE